MSNGAFRREDIPGINPALRDLADPFQVAQKFNVPMSKLRARQIADAAKVPREMVNDFFVE